MNKQQVKQLAIKVLRPIVIVTMFVPIMYVVLESIFYIIDRIHPDCMTNIVKTWPVIFHPQGFPFIWPLFCVLLVFISLHLILRAIETGRPMYAFTQFVFSLLFIAFACNNELVIQALTWLRYISIGIFVLGMLYHAGQGNTSTTVSSTDDSWIQEMKQNTEHENQKLRAEAEKRDRELAESHKKIAEENKRIKEQEEIERYTIAWAEQRGTNVNAYNLKRELIFSRIGTLVGYSSGSVSVRNHNVITIYNSHGNMIRGYSV